MPHIHQRHLLSTHGSSRGTAYAMSNKIVRVGRKLFVGWLDSVGVGMVNCLDLDTGRLGRPFTLGETAQPDNHCGPALAATGDGHVHAILGSHHRPFHYRRTVKPGDCSAWTDAVAFGPDATYPSLTVGPDDTLHLACRAFLPRGVACKLSYMHKLPGEAWSEPMDVAITPIRFDYTHYGNSLVCDTAGTLHLAFHLFNLKPQRSSPGQFYLRSKDQGQTWTHSDGTLVATPATIETAEIVAWHPEMEIRGQGLACAPDGRVIVVATSDVGQLWTRLFRLDAPRKWTQIDLLPIVDRLYPGYATLQDATATFDRDGTLYVLLDVKPPAVYWGDPGTEVVLLTSRDCGDSFDIMPISHPDPTTPNWLSSLERRACPAPLDGPPAILYTHGHPGEGCFPVMRNEIHLVCPA